MEQYIDSIKLILEEGVREPSRTGVDRIRYHDVNYRFDLSDGTIPVVTTKKIGVRVITEELLWFLRGDQNIRSLLERDVHIWTGDALKKYNQENPAEMTKSEFEKSILEDDEFAKNHGDLGPIYGRQWRNWNGEGIDQIANAINEIKTNPTSSRIIVNSWNPSELPQMTLPPCHSMFQLTVIDGKLNLKYYQRSADIFLGVPFNITSYAILLSLLADLTGLKRGILSTSMTDAHIYANHVEGISEQIKRSPYPSPALKINLKGFNFEDYKAEDFVIKDYQHHPRIKGELSV